MTAMRARCKVFDCADGDDLARQFNAWHEAMENGLPGFMIIQSHMAPSNNRFPVLVVFWTAQSYGAGGVGPAS